LAALCLTSVATVVVAQEPRAAFTPTKSPGGPRDLDGVWYTRGYDRTYRTLDKQLPPFTERGRTEREYRVKQEELGKPMSDASTDCKPHGVPRIMASPYPIQIISAPGEINIVHEVGHNQRVIYMNEEQPKDAPRTYLGHSVGHWEGDTLVVDTRFFNTKTMVDEEGIGHSDQLHVVERIRKIDDGKRLENMMTITDPVYFTAPWTAVRLYDYRSQDTKIEEYICEENNRNAPDESGRTTAK
jgi:hypothetical protein